MGELRVQMKIWVVVWPSPFCYEMSGHFPLLPASWLSYREGGVASWTELPQATLLWPTVPAPPGSRGLPPRGILTLPLPCHLHQPDFDL